MNNLVKPTTEQRNEIPISWKEASVEAHAAYVKQVEEKLKGKTFGYLTFRGYGGDKYVNRAEKWLFDCTCGRKDVPRNLSYVLTGRTKSCGCRYKKNLGAHKKDLTGQKFGKLTAISRIETKPVKWQCTCECGSRKEIVQYMLTNGTTTHCGCESQYQDKKRVLVKIGVAEMSLTDWANIIGLSRQRAHQLYKKGLLQGRVESVTS